MCLTTYSVLCISQWMTTVCNVPYHIFCIVYFSMDDHSLQCALPHILYCVFLNVWPQFAMCLTTYSVLCISQWMATVCNVPYHIFCIVYFSMYGHSLQCALPHILYCVF